MSKTSLSKGQIVTCNHVIENGTNIPYYDVSGKEQGKMTVGARQSNNKGFGHKFNGEKTVFKMHPHYVTLVMTSDEQYYPREMLLVKGVDYDE